MKKISVKFGHSNMWPNGQNEGVKHHLIDGVCIEANYDGGNWWVEEVSIDGEIANAFDCSDLSNFEGPSIVREMLTDGIEVEEACEKAGAKWMVEMNSYRYFFFK